MRTTTLGARSLVVGRQGLGCLSLTGYYGREFDRTEAERTIDRAIDLGVTLFDTADYYGADTEAGFGSNEVLVGSLISGRRSRVVLSSKFGLVETAEGRTNRADAAYVRAACESSLHRLGIDEIDLYYCHRLDTRVPIEETVGAMAELVDGGKVRHLGLCAVTAEQLRRANEVHPITALQSEWSLWSRDIETTVLEVARELHVGIVPYAPLGRGFLTGQIQSIEDLPVSDFRRKLPRFQQGNFEKNLELVDCVRAIASQRGCTPAQVALAWLHSQGDDVVPIPGADTSAFVEENTAAADLRLTSDDLRQLEDGFSPGAVSGDAYQAVT